MQNRIEHKSMILQEERQLLYDMKETFGHIKEIQECSKFLDQGMDSLRKQILQAERNVQAIKEEFDTLNFA